MDYTVKFKSILYSPDIGLFTFFPERIYGKDDCLIPTMNPRKLPAFAMGWRRGNRGEYIAHYISYSPNFPGLAMTEEAAEDTLRRIIIATETDMIKKSQKTINRLEQELKENSKA